MEDDTLSYDLDELAERAGLSRRTIRYYQQRGLVQGPTGLGRGKHWTAAHLERLLWVKAQQEAGRSLDAISGALGAPPPPSAPPAPLPALWARLAVSADVELHVRAGALSPDALQRLHAAVLGALAAESDASAAPATGASLAVGDSAPATPVVLCDPALSQEDPR